MLHTKQHIWHLRADALFTAEMPFVATELVSSANVVYVMLGSRAYCFHHQQAEQV